MAQNTPTTSSAKADSAAAAGTSTTKPANVITGATLKPHTTSIANREQRIADAAYQRAEQRGFAPGNELEDWLDAEREIDGGYTSR
jgi:hypothetical protein